MCIQKILLVGSGRSGALDGAAGEQEAAALAWISDLRPQPYLDISFWTAHTTARASHVTQWTWAESGQIAVVGGGLLCHSEPNFMILTQPILCLVLVPVGEGALALRSIILRLLLIILPGVI